MARAWPAVQVVPPGQLAYGMQLPIVAQSPIFAQPWEAGAGAADIVRIAEACDRAGFLYLAVSDHVCIPRERAQAMSTVWYDPVATLGFLAAATRHVRLLSYVYVLPYRHPLATAKAFATLDALSGGRVILGVGAGHLEGEFRTLGVDFARRGRLVDESIDVIVKAFLDEFPDHDGPTWRIHGVGVGPRARPRAGPGVWVGGSTRAALRRAAERGDGWLPQGVPPMGLAEAIAYVRRVRGDEPIEIGANSPWLYVGKPSFDLGPNARSGSGEQLAGVLLELKALGVNHVGVRFRTRSADELLEQIDAFAREVVPHL